MALKRAVLLLMLGIGVISCGDKGNVQKYQEGLYEENMQPPTAPTGLTITAIEGGQLDLFWTASTDPAGISTYKVYRDGTYLISVAATSFSDTGLAVPRTYCYQVTAVDAAGTESAKSAEMCATTLSDVTAPTAPQNVSATAASATRIDLSWTQANEIEGVTGFNIYRDGVYVKTTTITTTSDTGLSAETNYCYTVTALDQAGNESAQSEQACATTEAATAPTNSTLPDTGQTTSYTTTFGEDHDYLINPPSYTDNGDGTVADTITGLVWQKEDDAITRTWEEAGAYCSGNAAGLPGTGWRLPTEFEMTTIVDYGRFRPALDPVFTGAQSSNYWTSTTVVNNPTYAWNVIFYYGYVSYNLRTNSYYVRCVR